MVAHGALVMFIRPPQGTAGISVLTCESIILKGNEKKTKDNKHEEKEEGSGAGKSACR